VRNTQTRGWSDHDEILEGNTDIPGERMFDHVKFGVSDYAASKAFYLKALAPLGIAAGQEGAPEYGVELTTKATASLCLFQTREKPAHLHLAFAAETRTQVDAFYRAALEAGGTDNGAPGLRPHYHAHYYAAFVIGPDGHNIEVVCHAAE
jgi:catechol 2,3-dioxygenase-like lactoylglutathione lyase family enzyme